MRTLMAIFKINGREGSVVTAELPSGDTTLRASGDDALLAACRQAAKQYGGQWNAQFNNWVVPAKNKDGVLKALALLCTQVA